MDKNQLFKFEVVVPEELRPYACVENAHKEFQKIIHAGVCNYIPERGVLFVVSRNGETKKHCDLLIDMHFRSLSQKVFLLKKTEEAAKQLESTKLHTTGG